MLFKILVYLLLQMENAQEIKTLNGIVFHWNLVFNIFAFFKELNNFLVYTAPYLYIVYCDFLEIVRVASLEGENSPYFFIFTFFIFFVFSCLTDDRFMFKCRSAHRTGKGPKASDVVFAVSTEDRVELHIFHTSELEHAVSYII